MFLMSAHPTISCYSLKQASIQIKLLRNVTCPLNFCRLVCYEYRSCFNLCSHGRSFINCHYQEWLFRQLFALLSTGRAALIVSFHQANLCNGARSPDSVTRESGYYWKRQRWQRRLNKRVISAQDVSTKLDSASQCQAGERKGAL